MVRTSRNLYSGSYDEDVRGASLSKSDTWKKCSSNLKRSRDMILKPGVCWEKYFSQKYDSIVGLCTSPMFSNRPTIGPWIMSHHSIKFHKDVASSFWVCNIVNRQTGRHRWKHIRRFGLGSAVVRALDLQSTGRGFDYRPPHCRVATLDKSFTCAQRLWSYDRMVL